MRYTPMRYTSVTGVHHIGVHLRAFHLISANIRIYLPRVIPLGLSPVLKILLATARSALICRHRVAARGDSLWFSLPIYYGERQVTPPDK